MLYVQEIVQVGQQKDNSEFIFQSSRPQLPTAEKTTCIIAEESEKAKCGPEKS
jgi:hypothetical protein